VIWLAELPALEQILHKLEGEQLISFGFGQVLDHRNHVGRVAERDLGQLLKSASGLRLSSTGRPSPSQRRSM
jgi:hypothetical protein